MTELKDIEQEIGRFRGRLLAAAAFVLIAFSLLAARLVYLQVFRHEELATQAEANRIAVVPIVPNRGLIVDRNGVVLATTIRPTRWRSRPNVASTAARTTPRSLTRWSMSWPPWCKSKPRTVAVSSACKTR